MKTNLQSLRKLCLTNIVDNLNRYCQGPLTPEALLECLPTTVMTDLVRAVNQQVDDMDIFPYHSQETLKYLIGRNVTDVELHLDGCNTRCIGMSEGDDYLNLIKYKCQFTLRHLAVLSGHFSYTLLNDTLVHLKHLQKLELSFQYHHGVPINDETLDVIGANLVELRDLDISFQKFVTNIGVVNLCVPDGHSGRCTRLSRLQLENTRVGIEGVIVALKNLPRLTEVSHHLLEICVKEYKQRYPSAILNLLHLSITNNNCEAIAPLVKACPNLTHIEIGIDAFQDFFEYFEFEKVDLSPLLTFPDSQLKSLSFYCVETNNTLLTSILQHHGTSLTKLVLFFLEDSTFTIDISIIGNWCSNLQKLEIVGCKISNFEKYNMRGKFCTLRTLCIEEDYCQNTCLSTYALKHLLMCPRLGQLFLSSVKALTDDLLAAVLEEPQHKTFLSQVMLIDLTQCDLSGKHLISLICHTPSLKNLQFTECNKISDHVIDSLTVFVNIHSIPIKIRLDHSILLM